MTVGGDAFWTGPRDERQRAGRRGGYGRPMLTRGRLALVIAAISIPVLVITASATGGKAPSGGTALLPDLQTAVPHHFTVQNQQQRETLRFSNLIGNAGAGDLRLHPESNITTGVTTGWQDLLDANGNVVSSQPVSEFVFHPAHNHWHITGVALFEGASRRTTGRAAASAPSTRISRSRRPSA